MLNSHYEGIEKAIANQAIHEASATMDKPEFLLPYELTSKDGNFQTIEARWGDEAVTLDLLQTQHHPGHRSVITRLEEGANTHFYLDMLLVAGIGAGRLKILLYMADDYDCGPERKFKKAVRTNGKYQLQDVVASDDLPVGPEEYFHVHTVARTSDQKEMREAFELVKAVHQHIEHVNRKLSE